MSFSSVTVCLLIAATVFEVSWAAKFPAEWKKCPKTGNEDCLKEAFEAVIKSLATGNKAFGLLPLDPWHFNEVRLVRGGNGPVKLTLNMTNIDHSGLKDIKVTSAKADWDNYKIEVDFEYPELSYVEGDYQLDGQILVLPMQGKGHAKFTFHNAKTKVILTGSESVKGDKKYFHVDKGEYLSNPETAEIYMSNLFNGKADLADNLLKFLNENSQLLMTELKPSIAEVVGEAVRQIANIFFSKIPVDKLYQ